MALRRRRHREAFTLVELLVVIGIIGVLIAILLPALSKARRQALMTSCMSSQRQLITALIMYCQDYKNTFPGGSGYYRYRSDSGAALPAAWRKEGGHYDPSAFNPYSCNTDEATGPTFLAKYVKGSKQIPMCPGAEQELRRVGTYWPANYWTGFWYPRSLTYKPEEIWNGSADIATVPQTPQKITSVKFPAQKVVIIDRKTYHDKAVLDIDKTADGRHAGRSPTDTGGDKIAKSAKVVAGFADGHVAWRDRYEMYDVDVNWTGRRRAGEKTGPEVAGVRGRDFE